MANLLNMSSSRLVGSKKLPYDAELEYLQGDDAAYINTGIYVDSDKYEFYADVIATNKPSRDNALFGCNNNYNTGYPGIIVNTDLRFRYGNQSIGSSITSVVGNEYSLKLSYQKLEVNGISYSATTTTNWASMRYPLYVFARNNQGNTNISYIIPTSWKFKSFKVKKDGNVILDFIPVRVGTTGYMYDKVSGQLFGNAGTGNFIIGADKTN